MTNSKSTTLLGKEVKLSDKQAEIITASRVVNYEIQKNFKKILAEYNPDINVCKCGNVLGSYVPLFRNNETSHHLLSGFHTCKSVWSCPVCSGKISEHRKNESKVIMDKHKLAGGKSYLLTQTLPHKKGQSLKKVLGDLQSAQRKFRQSAFFKRIKRAGMIGNITALEITYSKMNGWHPHIHTLVFMAPGSVDIVEQNWNYLFFAQWRKICRKFGREINSHGTDIRGGDYASEYVSKWGLEHELAKGHTKKNAKKKSITPFAMAKNENCKKYKKLILAYYLATKGKVQLRFSVGLRDYFGVNDSTDAEIVDLVLDDLPYSEVLQLSVREYYLLCKHNKLPEFLNYCDEVQDVVKISEYLMLFDSS